MSEIDEMASPSLGTNSIKLSTEHLTSLDLHQSIIGDSNTSGVNTCNKDKHSGSREPSIDRDAEFIEILARSEEHSKPKECEKSWGYYEGDSDEENKSDTLKKNENPPRDESPTEYEATNKDTFHTPSSSLQNLILTNEGNNEVDINSMTSNSSTTYSPINIIGYEQSDQNSDRSSLCESLDLPSNLLRSHHLHDDLQTMNSNSTSDLTLSMESNLSTTSKDSQESSSSMTKSTRDLSMGSVSKGPNKKKMWYHVFSASYKTRSGDFKRIFKELPAEERLVVDYSCALQKEILIQGRMYVSQNYISFYANIFGWETQTSIRLKEVTAISKEKTALVIPNAIQISTDIDKFFFTSFVTRDATHLMLFKLWQSALLDGNISNKEIWRLVHSSYGDELGVNSEEDDEFLGCDTGSLMSAPSVSTLTSEADDNKSIEIDQNQVCANEIGSSAMAIGVAFVPSAVAASGFGTSEQNLLGMDEKEDLNEAHRDYSEHSDTSDSEGETHSGIGIPLILTPESLDIPLDIPPCPVNHAIGRETVNTIINTDVDTLFTMLFTNSKFYLDLHTIRKTFDIVQSQWQQSPEGSQKVRQVSFTVTLNHVMGPKHSQVTETQVMLPESKPGRMYAIDSESVNSGIPYAESFYVTSHICMSRVSANESKLCIVNQIKYKKSVWGITKSFIEKNSWAGIEEFYSHLERALKAECEQLNAIDQSPMSSPRTNGNGLRRRVQRKKGKAPDVPICTSQIPLNLVRNGSLTSGSAATSMAGINIDNSMPKVSDGSTVVKAILSILACLLLLNAFLYFKLSRLETAASSPFSFPSFTPSITKGIPQNHQEWLSLLQQQEALHRIELQKWHDILISALKILQQAEADLESLKFHLTSYSSGKYNIDDFKEEFIKQVEDATDEIAQATNFRTESKSDLEQ